MPTVGIQTLAAKTDLREAVCKGAKSLLGNNSSYATAESETFLEMSGKPWGMARQSGYLQGTWEGTN